MKTRSATNIPIIPIKYSTYITELNHRIYKHNRFKARLNYRSANSWNHRGEKQRPFAEILLDSIELNWNKIFENDSNLLNIKDRVVQDISSFLHQNHNICEYAWMGIIKQYVFESIYEYRNNNDALIIKEQYLLNLDIFNEQFNIELSNYKNQYSIRKRQFIGKYKTLNRLENMRPVFLYINRNYYKLFEFSDARQTFIKEILYQTIHNNQIITGLLNNKHICPNINEKERNYMILVRSTLLKTRNLIESKYSEFIGSVLTRLFYKDISLHITQYI
jgi:hypothetical protein